MNKVILSYSLFDQKDKKFDRSGHDPFNQQTNRYWVNIPFIAIINKLCIPNSQTCIHVPKDLQNNPMYYFLDLLQDKGLLNLDIINKPHSGTEPTIWRVKSLWDDSADFCFCRDMDSILNTMELKSMIHFINSSYWIHNIRSIKQHNVEGTSLMAGLCGFNIKKITPGLPLPKSYDDYEKFYKNLSKQKFFLSWRNDIKHVKDKNGYWGCDQETLVDFFIKIRTSRVWAQILDTYAQPNNRVSREFRGRVKPNTFFRVNSMPIESMPNTIAYVDKNLVNILNDTIAWSGQPINSSGTALKRLINLNFNECKEMKHIIFSNNNLRNFYKI